MEFIPFYTECEMSECVKCKAEAKRKKIPYETEALVSITDRKVLLNCNREILLKCNNDHMIIYATDIEMACDIWNVLNCVETND